MERRSDWYSHPKYYEAIFGTDTKVERRIVLPTELILRASCGCNNHSG